MKVKEFQSLEASYPDAVVLAESRVFYKTYGKEAYVLAGLMGYQLIEVADTCRSGFPEGFLEEGGRCPGRGTGQLRGLS
jgi:hypothetical protein